VDVAMIAWPAGRAQREELRRARVPRLLLVAPDADPPVVEEILEDWVRLPATERDVRARALTLEGRARTRPWIDDDGLLCYQSGTVALSPVEQRIAVVLVERFETVAPRERLERAVWPDERPDRNRLDVHVHRLRARLPSVGLELRTMRSRGYVLRPRAPVSPANGPSDNGPVSGASGSSPRRADVATRETRDRTESCAPVHRPFT
jgi:DNA-binding winged helix-turn-helix (wHTH) protein